MPRCCGLREMDLEILKRISPSFMPCSRSLSLSLGDFRPVLPHLPSSILGRNKDIRSRGSTGYISTITSTPRGEEE